MTTFKRILACCASFAVFANLLAAAPAAEPDALELEMKSLVAGEAVTILHFWAPWCSNCKSEMASGAWARFAEKNPKVRVVFLNVWHQGQNPAPALKAASLGAQENFTARTHPNPSNSRGEKLEQFLGLPLQWVPTTWIFRTGKMRYALNYGEVRFDMLQQMVDDAQQSW